MKNIIIVTTFIISALVFNAVPTFYAEQNPPITPIQTAEQNPPITPSPIAENNPPVVPSSYNA